MSQIEIEKLDKKKLRKSIINGIPDQLRGEIWQLICKCKQAASLHCKDIYKKSVYLDDHDNDYYICKDLARTLT